MSVLFLLCKSNIDETTGSITFEEAGVYFVTIAVRDDDNRENIMTVKMPVREEAL